MTETNFANSGAAWAVRYTDSDNEMLHYGIKGMHWGVRRYVDNSGHLTGEGKTRLKAKNWGNDPPTGQRKRINSGRVVRTSSSGVKRSTTSHNSSKSKQDSEIEARRAARRRKLLIGAGAVAVAALGTYAAYKGLGKARDKRIKDILDTHRNMQMPTTSKDWDKDDLDRYRELLNRQTQERVKETTRGSVLRDTLHLTKREDVLRERRRGHEVANLYNHANHKGIMNRQIRDAESAVAAARKKIASGPNMTSTLSKDRAEAYNKANDRMWREQLQRAEDRLEELKKQKQEMIAKGYRRY